MNKIVVALVLFCVFDVCAAPISVGVYGLPPHMTVSDKGDPSGALPCYLQSHIFKPNGWHVSWTQAQFARILADLESGRLTMAVMLAKNKEREAKYVYSELPLFNTHSGVVVSKGSKLRKIATIHDLTGLRLGHDVGSIVPSYFQNIGVHFVFISGDDYFQRGLQLLQSKRVDGFFVPTISHGTYELEKSPRKADFIVLDIPDSHLDLYIAFNKNADKSVIEAINHALRTKQTYSKFLSTLKSPETCHLQKDPP